MTSSNENLLSMPLSGTALSEEENLSILSERARLLAVEPQTAVASEEFVDITTFQIGSAVYAFESKTIREICTIKAVNSLPCTPHFIDGLLYLRGQIITLVSLQKFLNLQSNVPVNRSQAMIVKSSDFALAFRVDQVLDVVSVPRRRIDLTRQGLSSVSIHYVMGVTDDATVVLDLSSMLSDAKLIVDDGN